MKIKLYHYILFALLTFSCKSESELAMERGIQFYEWEKIEKAILEFKYIIHNLAPKSNNIDYENIKLLARAHHNLAVAYAKKTWYEDALISAKKSFELIPSNDNKQLIELINKKINNNTSKSIIP